MCLLYGVCVRTVIDVYGCTYVSLYVPFSVSENAHNICCAFTCVLSLCVRVLALCVRVYMCISTMHTCVLVCTHVKSQTHHTHTHTHTARQHGV